jgi:hypothetical protein
MILKERRPDCRKGGQASRPVKGGVAVESLTLTHAIPRSHTHYDQIGPVQCHYSEYQLISWGMNVLQSKFFLFLVQRTDKRNINQRAPGAASHGGHTQQVR